MNKYIKSICAGVVASAIVAGLVFLKQHFGVVPEFAMPHAADALMGNKDIPGWLVHLILGVVVWPIIFALVLSFFNGPYWLRGIVYSILVWVFMIVVVMPFAGHGMFMDKTINAGAGAHMMQVTLLMHVVYGFFLGLMFTICNKCCHK